MTFMYTWKIPNNDDHIVVEYCFSSVDNCIKIVEMWVNGKHHSWSWVPDKGKNTLIGLLEKHYHGVGGVVA